MYFEAMKVALAQIAPVWLNRSKTQEKIIACIEDAASKEASLIAFGEGVLPGYPYWLSMTHGSSFNDEVQKEIHAHYLREAVCIEEGDLETVTLACGHNNMACYLGIIERPLDRGGHSVYCSLVYINAKGVIQSVHRKLRPTYEERLSWSPGDAHGLQTHRLGDFTVGGLNCWENWMPLARTALYGQGENLHIAVWPGAVRNTHDITPFIAKEGRSYSMAVSGLMRKSDIPENTPHYNVIIKNAPDVLSDGGSCIAAPDGSWIISPQAGEEGIYYADLDFNAVLKERQNFDPIGHYSRPDVLQLHVNKKRQSSVYFNE